MAAKLNLRRGGIFTNPSISEPFFNTGSNTLEVGYGNINGEHITLVKLGENTGSILFTGDITASNAYFTGNTTVDGNIYLGGDIFLGDGTQATDNINVNATFSGSIVPTTTDVFDLGAEGKYWNTIFALTGSFSNGIISGSSQLTTEFDIRYLNTNGDSVVSASYQITAADTFQFTESVKTLLDAETVISGSSQVQIDLVTDFTSFSSSVDGRLDSLENTDVTLDGRLGNLELFSSSQESKDLTLETVTSSFDDRLDSIESFTSSYFTDSASVDSRLDIIEGPLSTSLDNRLDLLESYTASLDNVYEEKASGTHTLFSGSSQVQIDGVTGFTAHSSSVDGRLIDIETTFSSSVDSRLDLLSDISHSHSNKTQLDIINQDLSNISNVTFNSITASANVLVTGNLTVLGSATEIQTTNLVISDKLITIASGSSNSAEADGSGIEIDGAGKSIIWDDATQSFILNAKVSSSVGFNGDGSELTGVTAFDVEYANVLNKPTLVSGSSQISYTGITNKPTLVSGSTQITDGSGLLSSSNENFTQFSSSIDNRVVTLETTFSSSIDSRLDFVEGVFSSSVDSRLDVQEAFSESLDSKFLNTSGDGVVTGSEQVTASLDLRYEEISSGTNTLVSGSSQIDVTQTQNYGSIRQYDNTDNTAHLNSLNVVSGSTYSSPTQGTLRATINGVNSDIDLGLQSTDIPTFNSLTASNLPEHGNDIFDAVLKGPLGEFGYRTLGNAAFYNVSSSISDGNPAVLGNAGAVKDYIDQELLLVGAGDITEVNSGNGLSGGALSGSATLTLNTGSQHFIDGVTALAPALPSGLVSSSSQVDVTQTTNYSSINQYSDAKVKLKLDADGVISGSSQIAIGNVNGFSTFSSSIDTRVLTEKGRVDAILLSSDADKDSFAEIVTLINSVDTTNDSAFGGFVTSSNAAQAVQDGRLTSLEAVTGSYLTSETDTLSSVTARGATTSTAISITNTTSSTTNTTGALIVAGGVGISGSLNVGGDVVAYSTSDRRLKDNIVNIPNALEKVQILNGVTWDWNDNADELQKTIANVGVIAQEVEAVLPQLVTTRDNGYMAVDYPKLTGLLIEAIKQQQVEIDGIHEVINSQQEQIKQLLLNKE
jgi:hypothetical protein